MTLITVLASFGSCMLESSITSMAAPEEIKCRHNDVHVFDNLRCCLACGETVFDSIHDVDVAPQHAEDAIYRYAELNYSFGRQIRLVTLFPGQQSDDICIDIVHKNLTDGPVYEAISYSWATEEGDDALSQTVYCRGRSIFVTKQCEAALRCLRRKGRKRCLWVDAISIDQGNIAERNHQVAFMSEIYLCASQVIIYLGGATEETDIMLDYLSGNDLALRQVKRDKVHRVVKAFLSRRWFSRVWVLQEVAFAQLVTMIAGNKTAQWTSVSVDRLLHLCRKLDMYTPSALRWKPASQPTGFLLEVLHKSRNCNATDPRDKVFAVIGLMSKEDRKALKADYSLTRAQVFVNLAVYTIDVRKDLNLLKYTTCQYATENVHFPPEESYAIPTWVPRWDIWAEFDPLPPDPDLAALKQNLSSAPSLHELTTRELEIEALSNFFHHLPSDEVVMPTNAWNDWLQIWLSETQPVRKHPSQQWIKDMALALTQSRVPSHQNMVCNRYIKPESASLASWEATWNSIPPSHPPCLRVYAHHLATVDKPPAKIPIRGLRFIPELSSQALLPVKRPCSVCAKHFVAKPICQTRPTVHDSIFNEFEREATRFGLDKFLFATDVSLGFTQAQVQRWDSVWLLPNADVLFLLRKVEEHYELLGECYLYRALRPHPCLCCGAEVAKWKTAPQMIDIW